MIKLSIQNSLEKELNAYLTLGPDVSKQALTIFKNITPKRTGNARSNTKLTKTTILADYAYADKLDKGSSSKAPQGMSKPTIEQLAKIVEQELKKKG